MGDDQRKREYETPEREAALPASDGELVPAKAQSNFGDRRGLYAADHRPEGMEAQRRVGHQASAPGNAPGDGAGSNMELLGYVRPLLRWWWLILISAAIGVASGYWGARSTPRQYQAGTTLEVGQALQNPNASTSDLYTGQALAQTYADLVKRQPVLQGTLDALGLKWNWTLLRAMVTSRVVPGTQLIEVSVVDTDPQRVQMLANGIAKQLILQSPSTEDPANAAERQFVQGEIDQLKADIQKSRSEIQALDDVITKSNSARQIEDARSQQTSLQTQITTWEATYAQLLTSQQKGTPNFLSIVETAQLPLQPISPGLAPNMLLGMAMGLVLSGGAAFLLEYLDDTIKNEDDVRRTLGLTTVGRLQRLDNTTDSSPLVVVNQPRSPASGAYRVLRTNLQFSSIDHPLTTLMVTSPSPREGKSVTAANLAAAMAQAGQSVILVDADLWAPVQHKLFELNPITGLTNVLRGDANLQEALQTVSIERLYVLTAGPLPPNPADLLGSRRMEYLIDALREQAEVIIFDTPPVMVDADAAILSTRVDGVVLVVDSGSTRRSMARRSQEALGAAGAKVVGVALNRVRVQNRSYSYYYAAGEQQNRARSAPSSFLAMFTRKREAQRDEDRPLVKTGTLPNTQARRKPKHSN